MSWSLRVIEVVLLAGLGGCGGAQQSPPTTEQPSPVAVVAQAPSPPPLGGSLVDEPEEQPATSGSSDTPTQPAWVSPTASSHPAQSAPASSSSAADKQKARELFREAVAAFTENRCADARDLFLAAYNLVSAPPVLYNLARAEICLGNTASACKYYRDWKQAANPSPTQLQQASNGFSACP